MPRGRHAVQHSGEPRQARQDRTSSASGRRRTAAFRWSLALAAAFSLLIVAVAVRAIVDRGNPAVLGLECPLTPRLAADSRGAPAPAAHTSLGVNVSGVSGLAAATAQFGHMPVIRAYYPAVVPMPSQWSTGVLGRSHASVVLSFRPLPGQILSGADDAALRSFFDAAPLGHAIYYSYYHEPEAHIKAGEFTLGQYKAAWAHIVTIADKARNPYLHATLILQHQDADPGDQYNFRDYLPPGRIISTLGWDAYPEGTQQNDPQPTPPAQFMGPAVAASKSVDLPFGFAEFALGTSRGRPQWLTDVANYMDSQGALFGTLFDAAGFPLTVLHDSASINTWRALVARSANGAPPGAPSASTAAPSPTRSVTHGPSPAPHRLAVTGLSIRPRTLSLTGAHQVTIRFQLSQAARVSICVFNMRGNVVRKLGRWYLPAGSRTYQYYGHDQHQRLVRAGCYHVIVMASNASGTTRAQRWLAVTGHPLAVMQPSGRTLRRSAPACQVPPRPRQMPAGS